MSCPKCGDKRVGRDDKTWRVDGGAAWAPFEIAFCPFCGVRFDGTELLHQEYMRKHPYRGPPLDGGAWTYWGVFDGRMMLAPTPLAEGYFTCRDCGRKLEMSEPDERGYRKGLGCPDHPNTYLVAWLRYAGPTPPSIGKPKEGA